MVDPNEQGRRPDEPDRPEDQPSESAGAAGRPVDDEGLLAGRDVGVEADDPVEPAEPVEPVHPRRAASAEFVVQSEVGSDVVLREAMDPANQSLTDALRLSYRVLQFVMVLLIVLFFTSGFQTVDATQSGVFTRFGRIVPVDGNEALKPGFQPTIWPYPIGEFILVDVESRAVDLDAAFWPLLPPEMSIDEATERATVFNQIRPGVNGTLLTADGDLAHMQLSATYEITDPVRFLERIPEAYTDRDPRSGETRRYDAADKLVAVAIERATVRVAAGESLGGLIDPDEDLKYRIQRDAQALLDHVDSGIRITTINVPNAIPPLAIKKAFGTLQEARENAQSEIERARQRAGDTLLAAAGENYRVLDGLIQEYQEALDGDTDESPEAILARIDEELESDRTTGEASRIIAYARDYGSQIDTSLGAEAQRFSSQLAAFERHPNLVSTQLWLEAQRELMSQPGLELYQVPPGLGTIRIAIKGSSEKQELERAARLDRKELEARGAIDQRRFADYGMLEADLIVTEGPGRRLRTTEGGGVANVRDRGN